MTKKIIYGLIAIGIIAIMVAAVTLSMPTTQSTGSAITATRTISVMSNKSSYTTTTTQVTITGTTCDLMFTQYLGAKEYKAWAFASNWVLMGQQQFMDAINFYYRNSYGSQRVLYYGEIRILYTPPNSTQGWESALYFFDNGAAIIYPCP